MRVRARAWVRVGQESAGTFAAAPLATELLLGRVRARARASTRFGFGFGFGFGDLYPAAEQRCKAPTLTLELPASCGGAGA